MRTGISTVLTLWMLRIVLRSVWRLIDEVELCAIEGQQAGSCRPQEDDGHGGGAVATALASCSSLPRTACAARSCVLQYRFTYRSKVPQAQASPLLNPNTCCNIYSFICHDFPSSPWCAGGCPSQGESAP